MNELLAEKAARDPVQRKIGSSLLYARSGRFDAALAETKDPAQQIKSLHQRDALGRVLVDVRGHGLAALPGQIEARGGRVVDVRARNVRAWLPLDQLEAIAADPAVVTVHAAFGAMTWRADKPDGDPKFRAGSRAERVAAMQAAQQAWAGPRSLPSFAAVTDASLNVGSRTSEGVRAHAADRARQFFGADGTGTRVGVLSDSDDFKEQSVASGDLPANTITVPGEDGRPGTGEGTALLEIVHDVAPGAELVFATAFTSPESFAANIRALHFDFGCNVLIDDVLYFAESPYEDDIIAQAVQDVTADGALYFSAAGNLGNFDDGTSGTWEGDFRPAGALATLPSGYTVHSFGAGVVGDRITRGGGPLLLQWADPSNLASPVSSNDYDLFVLDHDLRTIVFASTDIQDGTNLPLEALDLDLPPGLRVVVAAHADAEPRALRVLLVGGELAVATNGATYGHSATIDGYSVAAVDVAEATGGEFTGGYTTPVELFTSDGPRRVFYDANHQPLVPGTPGGTFASRAGQTRPKPDIAGADGVSTSLPGEAGLNPFFGTSAAAAHTAGVAALIKSAMPTITPARLRSAIVGGAIDIGPLNNDRDSGRGIMSAYNTLVRAGARPATTLLQSDVTVTPIDAPVLVPGGRGQLSIAITNAGGAPATGVAATLTSSSSAVTITQATSSYPTIPAGGSATNTTPFAFSISSTAPCGTQLPFTLTVHHSATRTAVFDFTVSTGRAAPAGHFVYTGPPVNIPDGNLGGIDLTVEVGAAITIGKVVFRIDGSECSASPTSTTAGVSHTWDGDLTFRLTSPSGTAVTVIDAAGGMENSGNNFCQTFLDDDAATSIQTVTLEQAPYTGSFRPAQPLSAFAGEPAQGLWTVHISDNSPNDRGVVRAFSVDVGGVTCSP